MSQVTQINGNYKIKTASGGTITLDTGVEQGLVKITGDLLVLGNSTSIEVVDMKVEDNIILLNYGETGAGVTKGYSGLTVDRGSLDNSIFYYNELNDAWEFGHEVNSLVAFNNSKIKVREILTDQNTENGDLKIIGTGFGVITVEGTYQYEDRVIYPFHIPNKRYVDRSIINARPSRRIASPTPLVGITDITGSGTTVTVSIVNTTGINLGDTIFIQNSLDATNVDGYWSVATISPNTNFTVIVNNPTTTLLFNESETRVFKIDTSVTVYDKETDSTAVSTVEVEVDSVMNTIFYIDRVEIQDLQILDNEISTLNSTQDLKLTTNGTGKVRVNYGIRLDQIASDANPVASASILYSKEPGVADSGVYFTNTEKTDELISRNKALVFSMLF